MRFLIYLYICTMIQRKAQNKLIELADSFKSVAVIGPRQSGKTTLVKATFPDKKYISLENPEQRNFALEDPKAFLDNLPEGAILDEIQRAPVLFSYLQEILDNSFQKGLFILTGSNNFLLQESITQTLAGRIAYLTLLPFSESELAKSNPLTDDERMFTGFYPPIYDQKLAPRDWYPNYVRTYIERDVRQIKNIDNLYLFERFIQILAGRTGQELNLNAIGTEVGVNYKTIQSWISILESSFIVYLLKPHYKNFNKTIIKRPKLYFYDTGLVCYLLGITDKKQIENYPLRGAIFETMVIANILKEYTNTGIIPPIYYWRDKTGHEIDLIINKVNKLIPIEIKSGKTIASDWFKNLKYWLRLSKENKAYILYAGDEEQKRSEGIFIQNWKSFKQNS